MSTVALTIDDRPVQAAEGQTILQAASHEGIQIPNMCSHPSLEPFGACRLCLVEITKGDRTRIVASCGYPVEEGLVVRTQTPHVRKLRALILEIMMAMAPGVKSIRDLAHEYGVTRSRFASDRTYCILCGLCVRYCEAAKDRPAIGFVGRGVNRRIAWVPESSYEDCAKCGECTSLCPTGVFPSNFALGIDQQPAITAPVETIELPDHVKNKLSSRGHRT